MEIIDWILVLLAVLIAIPILRAYRNFLNYTPFGEEKANFLDWIKVIGLCACLGAAGILFEESSWWALLPSLIVLALLYDWAGKLKRFYQRRKLHQENLKREESIRRGKEFLDSFPVNNSLAGQSFIRKVSKKK
tara:strand:+ start:17 stop:418 length:402 start_codon:yes stop_codon:yes gene_type:complete